MESNTVTSRPIACMYNPENARVTSVYINSDYHMELVAAGWHMLQPITIDAINNAGWNLEFHYHGYNSQGNMNRICRTEVGPRGGETQHVIRVRASGQLKTWKTRPGQFRQPVKHGLYDSTAITHEDAHYWHLATDCPMVRVESSAVVAATKGG